VPVTKQSSAAEEAKKRGLKSIGFGRYVEPKDPSTVVAKIENGRLVLTKPGEKVVKQKGEQPDEKDKSPKPARGERQKNKVTSGGDEKIKNQVVRSGFKEGLAAPGNAASALNEIMTGEALHIAINNPEVAKNPKKIAEMLMRQYGTSRLFRQNKKMLQQKLVATAKAGVSEAKRITGALKVLNVRDPGSGWSTPKINHFYGAKQSLEAMKDEVKKTAVAGKRILSPGGDEIPAKEAVKLIDASGRGANPSDTAVLVRSEKGDLMVAFTSNKLSTGDQQANSTLSREFGNAQGILRSIGKLYEKRDLAQGHKLLEDASTKVSEIEANLRANIGVKVATVAAKSPRIQKEFLRNMSKLAPIDLKRWEVIKRKVGAKNDAKAASLLFARMARGEQPTAAEAELIARGLKGVQGVPSAARVSAKSREQIVKIVSDTRKKLDTIKGRDGLGMGTAIEAKNLTGKLHLDTAFEESKRGVNAYNGLFETNMGGVRLTKELLQNCLGANNEEEFKHSLRISDPIPMRDDQGNLTGAVAEIFGVDARGKDIKLARREVRSKQGITGKLKTTYKWETDMQRCFREGNK
jgi:hypothetical protein